MTHRDWRGKKRIGERRSKATGCLGGERMYDGRLNHRESFLRNGINESGGGDEKRVCVCRRRKWWKEMSKQSSRASQPNLVAELAAGFNQGSTTVPTLARSPQHHERANDSGWNTLCFRSEGQ